MESMRRGPNCLLDTANDLIKMMQNKGVPEDDVERLSLSATRQREDYERAMTAVELLRSGITLTQIYSQQKDLLTQKDKRKRNKGLMEDDKI